ncbi:GntR family transcriptional regulator [Variovorax terrae]|uniref:GntR family transcriptional regulator n=1 Tax=Variovorax terrae TaxID=2923278 RepID=A0A9X1W3A8_9BURK|nr:GntR family transcriptional regulator [Variovorax terrae]
MNLRSTPHGLLPLTDTGSVPLYRQVKRELLRLIESGRCGPGETLPSETEISRALQVSIGTLRKAVDELVHEHVLVRRQGKGTYVALHNDDRFLFHFFHVEPRQDLRYGEAGPEREYPLVECVEFEKARADEMEAAALRIKPGDPVFRIDNRLSLDGRAVVHDHLVISALLFKGLTEKCFRERPSTIYNLYQTNHGITVLRAQERARATAASRQVARILGIPAGQPVLEVHRIALTFGEKPVEFRISTINTQSHDYVSVLSKRM